MNKFKDLFDFLFFAYITKGLIWGLAWPEAFVILITCAFIIINRYFAQNKKIQEFEAKLAGYERDVTIINNNLTTKIESINNNLGKISLGSLYQRK